MKADDHPLRLLTLRMRGVHRRITIVIPMKKWEYLTAPVLIHNTKMILDNFGADGWELVQILQGATPEQLVAYFKREKQ